MPPPSNPRELIAGIRIKALSLSPFSFLFVEAAHHAEKKNDFFSLCSLNYFKVKGMGAGGSLWPPSPGAGIVPPRKRLGQSRLASILCFGVKSSLLDPRSKCLVHLGSWPLPGGERGGPAPDSGPGDLLTGPGTRHTHRLAENSSDMSVHTQNYVG